MCNLYRNLKYGWRDWAEDFSQLKIPLRFPDPTPNLREEVRPTDPAPVLRPIDPANPSAGLEGAVLRWDLVPYFWKQPVKAKKFLATNARSETIATTAAFKGAFARRRCLVPADGFFEWTGEKGAKVRWLFTVADEPWFCFAGLWDHALTPDGPVDSFTILTTAAGPDMAPYHDRQPVIVPRERRMTWLDLTRDATSLFAAGPAGALNVEPAPAKGALSAKSHS
jgi:putative SOS response-associated peptidase YedK